MQRVLVAGVTGSGKSTLARRVAAAAGLPFHEMDALFHGPGWEPIPTFVEDVRRVAEQDRWVFDSHGYPPVRDLLWSRADTVVWLDYPRRVVMPRVLRRSLARSLGRQPVFNGNVESLRDWLSPEHPVRWAWTSFAERHADLARRGADPAYGHLRVVRLRSPRAARDWLASLG